MARIKILRDPEIPLTEEEEQLARDFGLPESYFFDPIPEGTIIEDAEFRENGEAWYNYPGTDDFAPWYSEAGDYEVLDG